VKIAVTTSGRHRPCAVAIMATSLDAIYGRFLGEVIETSAQGRWGTVVINR
jgi:hypothetical protein